MSDTARRQDATFRQMLEKFMNKMVTVHGFSPEEARHIVKGELQRAYDVRFTSRLTGVKTDDLKS